MNFHIPKKVADGKMLKERTLAPKTNNTKKKVHTFIKMSMHRYLHVHTPDPETRFPADPENGRVLDLQVCIYIYRYTYYMCIYICVIYIYIHVYM